MLGIRAVSMESQIVNKLYFIGGNIMKIDQGSSGVAKAGLATGGAAVCSEDHLVDRFTLEQEAKIAELQRLFLSQTRLTN